MAEDDKGRTGTWRSRQDPFPAYVIGRRWNLLGVNDRAGRLSQFLTSPPRVDPSVDGIDLTDALFSPDGLRPFIAN
ncbi:MAG TPA: hypothetical protein VEJ16_04800 [Alphaproteobacteria bacterium]|nr:hypothetical protein [Alphaproteobacteria bacterium]